MLTLDHRKHYLDDIRSVLSVIVSPIQHLIDLPESAGEWASETFSTRKQLQEENRSLRAKQLFLNTQLQKLDALEAENTRLRELLESSRKVGERVLIAEILSVDMEPFSQKIVINKGAHNNVYAGQPIINADGIMGQVVFAAPWTSTAMLITDPSHAIPVQINRNGLRAIAVGTGEYNRLELLHIPNNADIKVDDLLVTSGLGGRFPPGYPVGNIKGIERRPEEPFATVNVMPSGKLESTREVLLVWSSEDEPSIQIGGPEEDEGSIK